MTTNRILWIAAMLALLLAALALAGCGGATQAPTATQIASQPTAAPATQPPTAAPTHTLVPTNTPEPTATPKPAPADNTACVGCHTSQETLQALAVPEPTAVSLSEGEG
jgi:glucose/arabinose dehydrogenase